ncbi:MULTISPECIES: CitMHS family transporter [Pseudomonas]|uniref:Mg(2+)/citrate complex transporter n=4 Tax=Pseudomonas fluorescens group TaxID=136843 RepID=C3K096_PSEFS|nr:MULTISPECIES: citrate:proton symporter [Pseudomonas]KJZ53565.1 citrate transporter [Pseudomonas marginalis]KJZ55146.1 citrate transporter [Pseudomonas marginalis]MBZ6455313.1 citrate:proton symporter [Pseudomonas fluorescens group sp.]MBZ6465530.1 citrate:proton symporter [Pseudomonas fluorescens group sp.]MBZ6468591.1 citrate:proton symporter [Pseudomonas fluorescens group sp.]
MLATLGVITILCLLAAVMSKRLSPLVALIALPIIAALLGGFGLQTSAFIITGIKNVAPVVGMFVFAILFFGIMTDAGMLDPIIDRILRTVGTRPTRIVVGTATLALLVHLDGSGAVTFLVTVPAMLPLYTRLGIDKRILACVCAMAAGVNFLPWTGPVLRSSAALHVPVADLFQPLIPVQIVGLVFVFGCAWWLGRREEKRLGLGAGSTVDAVPQRVLSDDDIKLRRPRLFWVNLILTVLVMVVMIAGWVDPVVMFMLGTVLALCINYPNVDAQRARIDAHAKTALTMASILLAAGVFTGIMQGTGMLKAIAEVAVAQIPAGHGKLIPAVVGFISMPLSMLFDPDSYYFGVMPVIAEVGKALGVDPLQVAQASLLGVHTTGFPVSPLTPATFLLVGLCKVELADHQRFTIPFLFAASVLMTLTALLLGVI